jgi:hypothetical protein
MKIYALVLLLGAITAFAHLSWNAERRGQSIK